MQDWLKVFFEENLILEPNASLLLVPRTLRKHPRTN